MTNPNTAPVEQVDREAAAEYFEALYGRASTHGAAAIRRGDHDSGFSVQAFARHRLATTAPLQARVEEMELDLRAADALHDSAYKAGLKAGWNYCATDDEAGYAKATASTEHIAELRAVRSARAALSTTPATSRLAELEAGEPEHCCRCGHSNPSWSAPSPLWNAVMRGGSIDGEPLFNDMVCASCFMEIAEQAGVASGWTIEASCVTVPLETTTSSGRVWDAGSRLWADPAALNPEGES